MHFATVTLAAVDAGGYVNFWKILPILFLLLIWGRLLTWADKDSIAAHLPREALNSAMFGLLIVGFALFLFVPNYWLALGVFVLCFFASIGIYLGMRNKVVGLKDLKNEIKNFKFTTGGGKSKEAKAGETQLINKAGILPIPDGESPQRPAYDAAQMILTDPLRKGSDKIELRPSDGVAAVNYTVDGVAYNMQALNPTVAADCISYFKQAAGLDINDRRKPQLGTIKAALDGRKHDLEIATAGTTAGESMRIVVDPKKRFELRMDTLGMPAEQVALVKSFAQQVSPENKGIVLVSAPRQQGLTTLLYSILRAHDAFLTHIQTIEHGPKEDLEGITQNKVATAGGAAEELKQVNWVVSQQPDVIMIDEIANPASARSLIEFVNDPDPTIVRRVYIGIRAGSTFDSLALWRKLVGDDQLVANSLSMMISGRVLRRLCSACKVGFAPDPDQLKKYNMDPNRVTQLFQARTTPLVDQKGRPVPCTFCQELRFKGRFGVYEVFTVDKDTRQKIAAGGSPSELKQVFRRQRGRLLQEMALSAVEAGETSVQEVIRVMKGEKEGPATAKA
jgi:type IV pilus assembly protein PilB